MDDLLSFLGVLIVASIAHDAVHWLGELHSQHMNFQTLRRRKMAVEYAPADRDIVDLVAEVLEAHHPDLAEAHIGILMREIAPRSNGKRIFGRAKKVGPELKALIPHDFIIWFAQDTWEELNDFQKRALVDHELCHCTVTNDKAKMVTHDLNEFLVIIERYGFWWPQAEEAESVFQGRMNLGAVTKGSVETLNVGANGQLIFGDETEEEDA